MLKVERNNKRRSKAPLSIIRQLQELHKAGEAITVTVHRKKFKVEDAKTLEKLLDFVDWVETIEAIREGLEEFKQGKGIPWEEAKAYLDEKYGTPSRNRASRTARDRRSV